ncbi:MAG: hypothetical protein ACLFS3_01680 [Candidatus Aenigmatarchaeota archaeon]
MSKHGLNRERVERLAEDIVPLVGLKEEENKANGMPLRFLRGQLEKISSREIRQAVIRDLEEEKLYRTRAETDRGMEAAVTTQEPGPKLKKHIETLGEEYEEGNWSRRYIYSMSGIEIEKPETKYDYEVFSNLPSLVLSHMQRHSEGVEEWTENKLTGKERGIVNSELKGVDPYSDQGEREIIYRIDSEDGRVEFGADLILKKRKDCIWPVDPLEADKYMRAVIGSEDDPRRRVLFERAYKGEELAEEAADLIRDESNDYDEGEWKSHIDVYKSFFSEEEMPEFEFGKKKDDKTPITTDDWLKELDRYVDQMKGGTKSDKLFSETKRESLKDTKTARKNYREPILEFLDYIEDATYGRLKGGPKKNS